MTGAEAGRRRHALIGVAVALLAVGVHLPALGNDFAWDDHSTVVANEALHGLDRIGEVVTSPYLPGRGTMRSPYRPITSASYALSWAMGDGSPVAFHLFNLTAHALATVLVLVLLGRLGAPPWAAGAGAAVFAVHPVHVEAVAGIVGRGDVLMTVGALVASLAWLAGGRPRWLRALGVVLGCALAVGAKENGAAVPGLLLVLELLRRDASDPLRIRLRREGPLLLASVAVVGLYLLARWRVLGVVTTLDQAAYIVVLPEWLRVTTAVANLSEVARLLLFPADLSVTYGPAVILPAGPTDLRFLSGVVLLLGSGFLAWISARSGERWTALAVLWIAVALFLVSNLVVVVPIWLAERTLYLPSVGVAIGVAGLALLLRGRVGRRSGPALLVLVLVLGGWRSWERTGTWESSETVVRTLVQEHPESFRSQWWVARRLLEEGMTERALERYRQAVEINPNEARLTLDFARALILSGRPGEAEEVTRPIPPWLDPSRSVYLAQSLIEQGREEEAREVVREGLELFPGETRLTGQAERLGIGAGAGGG